MLAGGIPPWRAVVIAVGVGVALWLSIESSHVSRPRWSDDLPDGGFFATAPPWEVPGLTASRFSTGSFQRYLRPRLWALATELLRRRGIEPASPRAAELVGRRDYALLTGGDTRPGHVTSSVSALTMSIARIAVTADGDDPPVVRSPALAGLAGGHVPAAAGGERRSVPRTRRRDAPR
jgi:hypothetical protein